MLVINMGFFIGKIIIAIAIITTAWGLYKFLSISNEDSNDDQDNDDLDY
jgi:flagellar biogenesis protein FliO